MVYPRCYIHREAYPPWYTRVIHREAYPPWYPGYMYTLRYYTHREATP